MTAIRKILKLIDEALGGNLSLETLYQEWPETLADREVYEKIYDHVEAAVEHYPGKILFSGDSESCFQESHEYKALLQDKRMIELLVSQDSGSDCTEIKHLPEDEEEH